VTVAALAVTPDIVFTPSCSVPQAALRDFRRVVGGHGELVGDHGRIRRGRGAVQHVERDRLQRSPAGLQFADVVGEARRVRIATERLLVDLGDEDRVGQSAVAAIELVRIAKRADDGVERLPFRIQAVSPIGLAAGIGGPPVIGDVRLLHVVERIGAGRRRRGDGKGRHGQAQADEGQQSGFPTARHGSSPVATRKSDSILSSQDRVKKGNRVALRAKQRAAKASSGTAMRDVSGGERRPAATWTGRSGS
jgi:hypothetical protein